MLMDVSTEHVGDWAEGLAVLTGGLGHLFARPEPREVFADLIEGLLSDLGWKNGWTMAGRAGHATPHRIQKFLGEASWSADGLLAEVQAYVARELGDPGATLVLDDTQVIKKGDKSVGVAHQHCGTTGDVRNCQVMVMLTYAAASGHTFFGRRLYLPQSWTKNRERCRVAGCPTRSPSPPSRTWASPCWRPRWPCACRIPPSCWSGGMLILVEGAAESRSPSYVQMGDPVRVLDRSGQRVERAGIRKTLVRPVLVIERLELAHGAQEMALVPDQRTV